MTATLAPGSKEWLRTVTASKVAPILGISPFMDQFTMWHMMAGNLPPVEQTEAMRRGNFHEEGVLQEFFYRNPELSRLPEGDRTAWFSNWLAVKPDALANWDGPGDLVYIEAKTASSWDGWGEQGTDEVPEHYRAQVIVGAHVTSADQIHFAVMGPFWDFREYRVDPNPKLALAIIDRCREFYDSVQTGIEPELSASVAAYETWTKVREGDAEGAVEIPADLAVRYLTAVAGEKDVKPTKALIANYLDKDNAAKATCQGEIVAIRQKSAHGMSIRIPRKTPDLTRIEL